METSELLNDPQISRLLFYPPHGGYEVGREPFYVSTEDARLACYYHEFDAAAPVVVFFHGNAESALEYALALPQIFEVIGCNTFLVEYRGYGHSTGSPGLGHLVADCRPLLDAIPVRPDRRIYFGRSLGCLPAIEAASLTPTSLGLVLESGVADVERHVSRLMDIDGSRAGDLESFPLREGLSTQMRMALRSTFDIRSKLSQFRRPAVVTYALSDPTHRQVDAELLYNWLPGLKRLLPFRDGNHSTALIANIKTYCEQIRAMATGNFAGQ